MEDEIIKEVREIRDNYAREFNYDLEAIFEDLRRQQEERLDREILPAKPRRLPPEESSQRQRA